MPGSDGTRPGDSLQGAVPAGDHRISPDACGCSSTASVAHWLPRSRTSKSKPRFVKPYLRKKRAFTLEASAPSSTTAMAGTHMPLRAPLAAQGAARTCGSLPTRFTLPDRASVRRYSRRPSATNQTGVATVTPLRLRVSRFMNSCPSNCRIESVIGSTPTQSRPFYRKAEIPPMHSLTDPNPANWGPERIRTVRALGDRSNSGWSLPWLAAPAGRSGA
jgi:hypothetical protein